jgi:hypothetical protein
MTFIVGQELFWVWSNLSKTNQLVTVTKVGRKWVELSNFYRFDIKTGWGDGKGRSSPGRIYLSEAAYDAEQLADNGVCLAFLRLKSLMQRSAPKKGVKIEDIYEAARLLNLHDANDYINIQSIGYV